MNPSQNDSFGSFSSGQGGYIGQPGAYSAEPIMINNGGAKKSKRWVIVIILLLLLVGIVVAVLLLLLPHNNYSKEDFNKFANYVSYGIDSDKELFGVYGQFTPYEISIAASKYSDEDRIAYFEKVNSLYKKIANSKLKDTDGFSSLDERLNFLYDYSKTGVPDMDELEELFYKNGDTSLLNSVLTEYGEFETESLIINEYVSLLNTYASMALGVFETNNGSSEDNLLIESAYNSILDYVSLVADSVVKECFSIDAIINGEENA